MKITDNGTLVTLGLVGVVAAAGAVVKRGSAAYDRKGSMLGVIHADDPYEDTRRGWYVTNLEHGTRMAGPFRSEREAENHRRRLEAQRSPIGGSAARVSEADIRAAVARAKREIEADQKAGVVPRTVRSFEELHDHVDANAYGGFTDPDGPFHDLSSEALVRAANTVQAEIDAWLRRA